ncbi:MAG: GNAT family N-acetyltransferase [Pseudomonadota bacterium]
MLSWLNRELHAENGFSLSPRSARESIETLLMNGHKVATARLGTQLAGYALWWERSESIYIRHFVIRPELRRQGIGLAFARILMRRLPKDKTLRLDARTRSARAFWRAVGFRTAVRGFRYPGDEESAR